MYAEDALLPISALQHLLFCERQCALIHIERLWAENRLTVEGRHLHENAHDGPSESRSGVRIARGLPLRSFRIGLTGQADVVEFRPPRANGNHDPEHRDRVTPVEYKRGRPKGNRCDEVQLCAQAICLEEMLDVRIDAGQLFYGQNRRRTDVVFDDVLRQTTELAAVRLHEMIRSGRTPRAAREPKCDRCSLLNLCMPDAVRPGNSAARYNQRSLNLALSRPPVQDDDE